MAFLKRNYLAICILFGFSVLATSLYAFTLNVPLPTQSVALVGYSNVSAKTAQFLIVNDNGLLGIAQSAITASAGNNGITADTTLQAATTNLRLMGLSVRESAGTAAVATLILRHGVVSGTCTGNEIAYIELNANESLQIQYQPRGVAVGSGVCADVLAGTIDISTQTVTEDAP